MRCEVETLLQCNRRVSLVGTIRSSGWYVSLSSHLSLFHSTLSTFTHSSVSAINSVIGLFTRTHSLSSFFHATTQQFGRLYKLRLACSPPLTFFFSSVPPLSHSGLIGTRQTSVAGMFTSSHFASLHFSIFIKPISKGPTFSLSTFTF